MPLLRSSDALIEAFLAKLGGLRSVTGIDIRMRPDEIVSATITMFPPADAVECFFKHVEPADKHDLLVAKVKQQFAALGQRINDRWETAVDDIIYQGFDFIHYQYLEPYGF